MHRTLILLLAVLALLVAGCGSDAGASAAPSVAESVAASVAESAEESADTESAVAMPSLDLGGLDADPELTGRFPDTVGGEPVQVISVGGEMMMGQGNPQFDELMSGLGADPSDVTAAIGGTTSADGSGVAIVAFRVRGASQDEMEEQFLSGLQDSDEVSGLEQSSVGGKEVWSAEDPGGTYGGIFIYVKDDTLYWITGSAEQAAEIFEALP